MRPRELGGELRRAKAVYVWVSYWPGCGCYLQVPKATAREIVDDAKEEERDVYAFTDDEGDLHIGADDMSDAEGDEEPSELPGELGEPGEAEEEPDGEPTK